MKKIFQNSGFPSTKETLSYVNVTIDFLTYYCTTIIASIIIKNLLKHG
jgi:hypothetical protein